jgi:8-amino-7-oxononanoate synthase
VKGERNIAESPVAGKGSRVTGHESRLASSLASELTELDSAGLRRFRRTLETAQGPRVKVDGREYVAFCSNDYLGLASDARIVAAAQTGAAQYGVGSGASHLVIGHSSAHEALESALAQFVQQPRTLLFSTGYMANLGIVTALAGRDDAVFADRLNHASLNDAVALSRAQFKRYPHLDLAALDRLLTASRARRKLVVTDAVFSMDGDIAPLLGMLEICERHDAWLVVDDAHGFGVLGPQGRGALAHFDLASPRIVYMATLGKAAGVYGAFVAGQVEVVEIILQRARTYIYTTATPPMLAHALVTALAIVAAEDWRREHLQRLIAVLRAGLQHSPWRLLRSDTAIQPVIVGENVKALGLAGRLAERGLLVPAIRPPTVPAGTARLRISLSATHTAGEVDRLAKTLCELA